MRKLLIITVLSAITFAVSGEEITKIAAKVNNEVITSKDLDNHIRALSRRLSQDKMDAKLDSEEFRAEILQRLIEDKLILDVARQDKIEVPPTWVESKVNQMILTYPSREAFEFSLITEGLNLPYMREKLKEQYLLQEAIDRYVKRELRVSPQEISRYYKEHKDEFTFPPKYSLWIAKLTDDKDFNKLMNVVKRDGIQGAKETWPDLFMDLELYQNQLRKELAEAVLEIKEGKYIVKDIDETIHLIYLDKITPPRSVSLREAKEEIKVILESEKFKKRYSEWVEKLREAAIIKVY